MSVTVKLLRPLDGKDIGITTEYPDEDAKRLEGLGAVEILSEKAAPAPANKKAPEPSNKAAPATRKKGS